MPDESKCASGYNLTGGSCTCGGTARPGEPIRFDSSRCPIHSGTVLPALPMGHQPRPHKCPICHGTGRVAHSFYDPPTPGTSGPIINARVTCRGCGGRGVIVA